MPKNKAINLLPQEEFDTSITGRILKWATSTFRIIVIATEMVVMAAFLSRFWLDAQNSTLNNSIKIKAAQINAQADLEKKFRQTQSKLNIFSQIKKGQNTSLLLNEITSSVPESIILTRVSIGNESAEIAGSSVSDQDIAQFITNLGSLGYKKVELGQVGSSGTNSGETAFAINITY
jgi:hypothetical protein